MSSCDGAFCAGQCWLKYTAHPGVDVHRHEKVRSGSLDGADANVPWTTGVIPGRAAGLRAGGAPREAQRVVLKLGYAAHGGIFLGAARPDWAFVQPNAAHCLCRTG